MSLRRLKILHVVFSLEPGGMENGLVNVARLLSPEEFEVHVCCMIRDGDFAARMPDRSKVYVMGKGEGISPGTVWRMFRLIRTLRPDVIHTHNMGPLIYGSLASVFGAQAPLVHGEHGRLLPRDSIWIYKMARRLLYGVCCRVHTVSHSLKRHYVEEGFPASRLVAVVNGVDTVRYCPGDKASARARLGLPAEACLLGMVGSFTEAKRHRILIEAFGRLAAEHPRVHVVMVGGKGSEMEKVRQQARACAGGGRIHFAGYQSDPGPYYQAMDLLVMASRSEGLSNVVLEAMAAGVPVLAHTDSGLDVIEHPVDGWVCCLDTPELMEQALRELLGEPGRLAALGKQARAKILRVFSMASMTEGYAELYRQAAAGR